MIKVVLVLFMVVGGAPQRVEVPQPSLKVCWEQAEEFVLRKDSDEFKKIKEQKLLGAGCFIAIPADTGA